MKIGFNDRWSRSIVADQKDPNNNGKKYKIDRKKDVFLSERKKQELLKDFETVVVHDFGDGYHQSEEEKEKENIYYKEFSKLSKSKHKYKKLDQFVIVMRQVLKCLDMVAERNMLYDPVTFKKMWLSGKIEITGLFLPQYKGKDKKQIAWDYITEFILSDQDPSLLVHGGKEEYKSEEEIREYQEGLFTEEELEEIMYEDEEKSEKIRIDMCNGVNHDKDVATYIPKKKLRKILKDMPELTVGIRNQSKVVKKNEELRDTFVNTDLESEDFNRIRRYDAKRNQAILKKKEQGMPEFKGDIFDKDDFNRYMYEFEEWRKEHTKKEYYGKTKTEADIEEMEVKALQEENGWNIRNLYNNREIERSMEKSRKRMRKKEKDIKKKLIEIQKRNEKLEKRMMGKGKKKKEDFDSERKKKKKGKKKKRRNAFI